MTKEEMIKEYDEIMASETIDLERADNLKSALSGVFEDLTNSQKDNEFYIKQVDDLKRQNRALYLKTNPTVEVEQPKEPEQPTKSPFEMYCSAFDDEDIKKLF